MTNVRRYLRWFTEDAMVGEVELRGIALADLQRIFGVECGNPLYDCFRADPGQIECLRPFMVGEPPTHGTHCFVEADGKD